MQKNGKLFIQTEPVLELVGYVPEHFKERLVSDMRPIDADALVKRLKHSPLFLGTNLQFKDGVIDLVERQPTIDVVSRQEHEEVRYALDTAVKALANAMREAEENEKDEHRIRQETAREIFEEIDRMTYKVLNDRHYIMGDMCYDVAELKKKYTEDGK